MQQELCELKSELSEFRKKQIEFDVRLTNTAEEVFILKESTSQLQRDTVDIQTQVKELRYKQDLQENWIKFYVFWVVVGLVVLFVLW